MEKTEGSSINFSEKLGLVENTVTSTPRKASQFSDSNKDSGQRMRKCQYERDNSFDRLAKTFGFGYSINTCFMSESECQSEQEETEKEKIFYGHKMKTLNIIEDDISDIEGSIDQTGFAGNMDTLLDRSANLKCDSD
jgi:hypothetical protein